ncbi:hypothetical protein AMECASPLE_032698 [Ameca splendens]|uniref:Uncharacterized protein n=1 Tax=Ameca splendens TaxID=208324 RepID=A0ABV0YI28_9TELE
MGVEVPQQNDVHREGYHSAPLTGMQEGLFHSAAQRVGQNNLQRPSHNPKEPGCNPFIQWGKPQHETAKLGGNKQMHPSPPRLPLSRSRGEESSTSIKELGSRAYAVHRGELHYS